MVDTVMAAPAHAAKADVTAEIKRFRRRFRRRIRNVAKVHDRLADLVVSFPAAAFALATDFGQHKARRRAVELVKDGQSLRLVAKALGVPLWMRKLPPEAFRAPFAELPDSERFKQGVGAHIPRDVTLCADWLYGVLEAWQSCDEDFALWFARQPVFGEALFQPYPVLPLALYAWFSMHPECACSALIESRWSTRMRFDTAIAEAGNWWENVKQQLFIGGQGVQDSWLSEGKAAGYRFVPLMTQHELEAEAKAMNNCVCDYAEALARGRCRLFGVRRAGRHVATLEIQAHPHHPGIPQVVQLYGPGNDDAPTRVWKAAFAWLSKQAEYNVPDVSNHQAQPDVTVWRRLWQPYLAEKGVHPFLSPPPDAEILVSLDYRLQNLGRRA